MQQTIFLMIVTLGINGCVSTNDLQQSKDSSLIVNNEVISKAKLNPQTSNSESINSNSQNTNSLSRGNNYVIGDFNIKFLNNKFIFGNSRKEYLLNVEDNIMNGVYIVKNPFFNNIKIEDGIPVGNQYLIKLSQQTFQSQLESINQYKFSFFKNEPTTIAILYNFAGASGGSSQTLYLFDTTSNKYATIETGDWASPYWLEKNTSYPPIYANTTSSYIGPRAYGIGVNHLRISEIFTYDQKINKYIKNEKIETVWFNKLYNKSKLSNYEINYIKDKNIEELSNKEDDRIITKLLDNIHYAKEANKLYEVMPLINSLNNSLKIEFEDFIKSNSF